MKQLDRLTKWMTETAQELAFDDLHPARALVALKSQGILYVAARAHLGEEVATETLDTAYKMARHSLASKPI